MLWLVLPRQKARAHQLTANPKKPVTLRAREPFQFHFTPRDDERGAADTAHLSAASQFHKQHLSHPTFYGINCSNEEHDRTTNETVVASVVSWATVVVFFFLFLASQRAE